MELPFSPGGNLAPHPPLPISVGLLLLTIFGINAPNPVPPDPMAQDRAAIEASLPKDMQGSPTIAITSGDVRLFGDQAVTWGTWAMEASGPTGDPMAASWAYLNYLERVEGAWRIAGNVSNYDSPRPAEGAWGEGSGAPPLESRDDRSHPGLRDPLEPQ